ncbi:YkgJ family cysteine cluster protein [Patescibacteria group bacterium]
MKLQNNIGRTCGKCNACCKTYSVPGMSRDSSGWCQHCDIGRGCAIYEERPEVCRYFTCAWLNGTGDESWRPDRFGVMIDVQDVRVGGRVVGVLHLWEIVVGGLEKDVIKEMAELHLAKGFIVVKHTPAMGLLYRGEVSARKHLFTPTEVEEMKALEL